jgi:peptidoglycan/xylan/chitin deacetylase (PgdA/CDA1 family)
MANRCGLILWVWWSLCSCVAWAQTHDVPSQKFAVVAFHDVQDRAADLDHDAVTTDRLVAFFDHLRGDGWNPVSLQDLSDARRGVKPLPSKPILITFDDGYSSLYSRVFPLLLAYRIPVVAALVGEWMNYPPGSLVPYAGKSKPREFFLDWVQAREMQASGLVEFASHTYNLHRELMLNPQGNKTPALLTLSFDPATGLYETPVQYRQRLLDDLKANEALLLRELGKKPRAVAWPYGRYNQTALEVLEHAGYEFALTLDYETGHVQRPLAIGRYWPTGNLRVANMVNDLRYFEVLPRARRMVRIDPGQWWTGQSEFFEQRLSAAIELLRQQAITDVVIEGLHRDLDSGRWSAWFPTRTLPLRADVLSRVVWQLRTRAGVRTSVDLSFPAMATHLPEDELKQLHVDLGWHVPTDGLWMSMTSPSGSKEPDSKETASRWASVQGPDRKNGLAGELRAARSAISTQDFTPMELLAIEAFRSVEYSQPGLNWLVHTQWNNPAPLAKWADLVLMDFMPDPVDVRGSTRNALDAAGVSDPLTRRRTGIWIQTPQALNASQRNKLTRELQAAGLAVMGGHFLGD